MGFVPAGRWRVIRSRRGGNEANGTGRAVRGCGERCTCGGGAAKGWSVDAAGTKSGYGDDARKMGLFTLSLYHRRRPFIRRPAYSGSLLLLRHLIIISYHFPVVLFSPFSPPVVLHPPAPGLYKTVLLLLLHRVCTVVPITADRLYTRARHYFTARRALRRPTPSPSPRLLPLVSLPRHRSSLAATARHGNTHATSRFYCVCAPSPHHYHNAHISFTPPSRL